MVATDGIVFDSRHPRLPISKRLGEWEETAYNDLVLFMPGVYWSKQGKDNVLKVKTRGVPKAKFKEEIEQTEVNFARHIPPYCMGVSGKGRIQFIDHWPIMRIPLTFCMTSCLQALMRNDWSQAGRVAEEVDEFGFPVCKAISAEPGEKRGRAKWYKRTGRIDSCTLDVEEEESTPYKSKIKPEELIDVDGIGLDNSKLGEVIEVLTAMRCEVEAGEWQEVQ